MPIFGWIGDKFKIKTYLLLLCVLTSISSILILTFYPNCTEESPGYFIIFVCLALYGISFALWEGIWVLIGLAVDKKY